ncbi:hypothetical protein AJ88_45170 [Mesorhizobium amorphae CCBAU 01583]|nr:hypothetical protein AJ88_45170 [Mesorhizobium amorphae CCBAU 01583]
MTITLAAVFAPLAFTGGLTGALFREFAVTLAGSVVLSGIIAVTITPMMSARLLKAGAPGRFQRVVDGTFGWVERVYEKAVKGSLNYRPVTLIIVLALVGVTGFAFTKTSSELAPEEDQGFLLSIVTGPRYATSDYTETYVNQILGLVKDIPETRAQFSAVAFGGQTNGASSASRSRTGPSAPAVRRSSRPTYRGVSARSPASRPSSSRRRRCQAPAAACPSRWWCARPALLQRSTRRRSRSRTRRRPPAVSSSCRTRCPTTRHR